MVIRVNVERVLAALSDRDGALLVSWLITRRAPAVSWPAGNEELCLVEHVQEQAGK
jgi:hypothetical protein